MSNLDAGQGAVGEVFCAASNISSEVILTQQFNPGNDTTGVGTIDNPYLTPDQALKEIRVFEGQAAHTKQWKIWMISKNGEVGDYPRTTRDGPTNYPESAVGGPDFYIIHAGYNKDWGPTPTNKWDNINDKPIFGGYTNSLNGQAIRLMKATDLTIKSDAADIWFLNTNAGDPRNMLFYHCRFQRIISTALIHVSHGSNDDTLTDRGFFGCTFDIGILKSNGFMHNCLINNGGTGDCMQLSFGGTFQNEFLKYHNCIFLCDGIGFFCLNNGDNLDGWVSDSSTHTRTGNTYRITNGAQFILRKIGGIIDAAFTIFGANDAESQGVDPIFVNEGEPALANASPVFDKGVGLGGIFLTALVDPTGDDDHLRDAVGEIWGDSIGPTTPVTANTVTLFSQRSPGPIQQPLGYVPPQGPMIFPVGTIGFITPFAVGRIEPDVDALGTCQVRLLQADDAAGTVNVLKLDSAPININVNNRFLQISEDGGGDVTVTLDLLGFNTIDLHAHLQTKLNAAGLTGTYTVAYNVGTGITTISATGLGSGFELKFLSGTNAVDSIARLFGFNAIDTAQNTTIDGDQAIDQNFKDASVTFEFASDYTEGQDPAFSGTWLPMGTGDPTQDFNDEGTNGVRCDGLGGVRHVRVDLGTVSALDSKFHGWRVWNGNLRSEAVALV